MTTAERFIFIGCLLQGGLCSTWSVQMPQSIQALNGSCVLIPCTFQIPSEENQHLIKPVRIWWTKRESSNKKQLKKKDNNWNIIGNLSEKNCTTVLKKIRKKWNGDYSLTIEGNNHINNTFTEEVNINVEDSPPSPQVTINRDMVKEGDSVTLREGDSVTLREGDFVTLTCSAPAPCPSLPPTLSWTPRLSDSVTVFQENDDHTKHVSSVMNFTASHLHHKQEVKCTAVYRLQADNSERTSHTTVVLKVQSVKAPSTWIAAAAGAAGMMLTCILMQVLLKKCCPRESHSRETRVTEELTEINLTSESENDTPVIHHDNTDHGRCSERGSGTTAGSSQSTMYGNINRNVQNVLIGTDVMSDVQEEQEQNAIRGMTGKRKKTRKPEHRDVSERGFRSQDSADSQKRKYESGTEQKTMEDRKSSTLDDQLKTPEPKEEATYGNICHQLCTNGPDKRSATVQASSVEGPQDHHGIAFYPLLSEETGTNESTYAVVGKVRSLQQKVHP